MSRRARQPQLNGRLRPPFADERVRQKLVEHPQDVLEKHVQLLTAADRPHLGGNVFVMPQRLISPGKNQNERVTVSHASAVFIISPGSYEIDEGLDDFFDG